MTDVGEREKQNNKKKGVGCKQFYCNLKEWILQIYNIPNTSLRYKSTIYWTIKKQMS